MFTEFMYIALAVLSVLRIPWEGNLEYEMSFGTLLRRPLSNSFSNIGLILPVQTSVCVTKVRDNALDMALLWLCTCVVLVS